ncbi:UDP-N-acetylglucosamine 1-carboxyvinyltransferase [Patescibacteria group bacterium]|nr:UDP-N-acetylglucosamine 1-carboxyvinyltransferase [Patescibacteria group bacterium]
MATSFKVSGLGGTRSLNGIIEVSGAKNAVLPALAASVMIEGELTLLNVPGIEDVSRMSELLVGIGASVVRDGSSLRINRANTDSSLLKADIAKRLRASVFLSGPLLASYGSVVMPHPGGDVIGVRPIDLFIKGFEKMGAHIVEKDMLYHMSTKGRLKGADIFFPFISVGATETLMMAATIADGTTTLRNAALEPEVVFLAEMLNACGAKISGIGTSVITIEGVAQLSAPQNPIAIIPDRIEAGTYLVLGALCGTSVVVDCCEPRHLEAPIEILRSAGVTIEEEAHRLVVTPPKGVLSSVNIRTHEYPGFATDLQAPMTVLLTQAEGEGVVFETIFEGRLNYVQDLMRMGADITQVGNHRVIVKGPRKLYGKELEGPDIRAGLAYVLAAITAEGESIVHNAYHIDRGYERVEEKLGALGARVERIEV